MELDEIFSSDSLQDTDSVLLLPVIWSMFKIPDLKTHRYPRFWALDRISKSSRQTYTKFSYSTATETKRLQ